MKQRICSGIAATLCALTLLCGVVPMTAYAKAPSSEGDAVVQTNDYRWYFRTNNGVREKRLWSMLEGRWVTDWIPA